MASRLDCINNRCSWSIACIHHRQRNIASIHRNSISWNDLRHHLFRRGHKAGRWAVFRHARCLRRLICDDRNYIIERWGNIYLMARLRHWARPLGAETWHRELTDADAVNWHFMFVVLHCRDASWADEAMAASMIIYVKRNGTRRHMVEYDLSRMLIIVWSGRNIIDFH